MVDIARLEAIKDRDSEKLYSRLRKESDKYLVDEGKVRLKGEYYDTSN